MKIAIFGAGGAIGGEFVRQFADEPGVSEVYAFSGKRNNFVGEKVQNILVDITDEDSISDIASKLEVEFDYVIVAVGMLHDENVKPEKMIGDITSGNFNKIFQINVIAPSLIAKYFLPRLKKDERSVFAFLSARVGSISDNRLGGWYAYRASKAALNMVIKNFSIEINRKNKQAIILGLHPGTVDSKLSKPFQASVPEGKLFDASFSVSQMIDVLKNLSIKDSGKIFAYEGSEIEY